MMLATILELIMSAAGGGGAGLRCTAGGDRVRDGWADGEAFLCDEVCSLQNVTFCHGLNARQKPVVRPEQRPTGTRRYHGMFSTFWYSKSVAAEVATTTKYGPNCTRVRGWIVF